MKEKLIEIFKDFKDTVIINILEDNKYEISHQNFNKNVFIQELLKENFQINGYNHKEFYIIKNDIEYTIQISNFELDKEIEW